MRWIAFIGWWLDAFMSALLRTSGRCGDTSKGSKMQWFIVYLYGHKCKTPKSIDGVFAPDQMSAISIAEQRHPLRIGQTLMCYAVLTNEQQDASIRLHAATNGRIEDFEIFMTLRATDRTKTKSGGSSED